MLMRRALAAFVVFGAAAGTTACADLIGADDATIIVENNSSVPVWFIYISPCTSDAWGDDELGSNETIDPGDDREFGVDAGCWDLRAEFSDDSNAQAFGIDVDEGDEFTWELVD